MSNTLHYTVDIVQITQHHHPCQGLISLISSDLDSCMETLATQ